MSTCAARTGRCWGFLFGWTEFLVIRAGSIASLASAFALYFAQIVPAPRSIGHDGWQALVAMMAMAVVAAVNILGTRVGGRVQVIGTALKVSSIAALVALPLILGEADPANLRPVWPTSDQPLRLAGFMTAMVGILWTYDGWVNASSLAEEIEDPGRNIPRALMLGVAILIGVYLSVTLMYHLVLPMDVVAGAATEKGSPRVVAAVFCSRLLGRPGLVAISLVVMASTLISLNGNALSGPRAYFALARDGLFPPSLCRIHPRFGTPANAIAAQAAWSIVLTALGTLPVLIAPPEGGLPGPLRRGWKLLHETPLYDVMYSYVIFGGTLIYALTIASVFVLRVKHPDWPRPYRTWGYPLTPALYLGASALL